MLEQLAGAGSSRANRAINGLLAFSFFLTLGGQVYSVEALSGWLAGRRLWSHPAPSAAHVGRQPDCGGEMDSQQFETHVNALTAEAPYVIRRVCMAGTRAAFRKRRSNAQQ